MFYQDIAIEAEKRYIEENMSKKSEVKEFICQNCNARWRVPEDFKGYEKVEYCSDCISKQNKNKRKEIF